jgi:hypothetical protein
LIALACILAVAVYGCGVEQYDLKAAAAELAWIAGPAFLLAAPFLLSIVGRYRLRISNPIPIMWRDPGLPTDPWQLVRTMIEWRGSLVTAMVLVLAVIALCTNRRAAVLVTAAFTASLGLFMYNQCLITDDQGRIAWPPIVPAHHFLIYERALEMILFGAAISTAALWFARLAQRALSRAFVGLPTESIAHAIQALIIVIIVGRYYPAFLARDAFHMERQAAMRGFTAEEPRALVAWLRDNSSPGMFLTSESACVSMVAPAGRTCILAPRFFSSPYVDWNQRSDAYHAMWNALVAGDCATFGRRAQEYRVRFVRGVAYAPTARRPVRTRADRFSGKQLARLYGRHSTAKRMARPKRC